MKYFQKNKNYPGKHSLRQRVSFQGLQKGSIIAEAAVAFPLFFMMTICMISIMNLYGIVLNRASALRDITEVTAAAADVSDSDLWIDITIPEYFKPFFLPDGLAGAVIPVRGRVRAWNGRSDSESEASSGSENDYVYVTNNRSVYHTNSSCTHLELSTRSVSYSQIAFLRNSSGGIYKPCEKCCRNGCSSHLVYITDDGDRYHSSPECSGLKRTVRLVPASSVQDLCECSRCAAARAASGG